MLSVALLPFTKKFFQRKRLTVHYTLDKPILYQEHKFNVAFVYSKILFLNKRKTPDAES